MSHGNVLLDVSKSNPNLTPVLIIRMGSEKSDFNFSLCFQASEGAVTVYVIDESREPSCRV